MKWLILVLTVLTLLWGCVSSREKKSARYYVEHEQEINEILAMYAQLYRHQPFNIGFSQKDYSYVGMDIITDTLRWALNSQEGMEAFREAVHQFHYDTVALASLYRKLQKIKCYWLGTDELYFHKQRYDIVFLSFGSVRFGNPFLDRKYYNLLFFDPKSISPGIDSMILGTGFSKVRENVYFKIMDRFR